MTFSYLVQTDTEPIAVTLTASGRLAITQDGISVYFPGESWPTIKAAVESLDAPSQPRCSTPAHQRTA